MYYAFEFVNGSWMEIGASLCFKTLETSLAIAGVKDYWIMGW